MKAKQCAPSQEKVEHVGLDLADGVSAPIMDEDDARREREEAIVAWFERPWHILNAYLAGQRNNPKMQLMAVRAMEFALGYRMAAGAEGPAELARKCGVSKQALGKCLNHFIEQLNLEPFTFQRGNDARENMAEARRRQVQRHD